MGYTSRIPEAKRLIERAQMMRMEAAVMLVHGQTQRTLSGPRTGRRYRIPGTKAMYTASAPGEPPARRTGQLANAVETDVQRQGDKVTGKVGVRGGRRYQQGRGADIGDVAMFLELGTRHMAPRPWLRRSFEAVERQIRAILGGEWF